MKELDLSKIIQFPFPEHEYIKVGTPKSQVCLHQTVSWGNAEGVFAYWDRDKNGAVGTCICIEGRHGKDCVDGTIVQGFSSKYWAWHLGLTPSIFKRFGLRYVNLNMICIGIEICNAAYVIKTPHGYYSKSLDWIVPDSEIVELPAPHRGHTLWHAFTDAQIDSTLELLLYWKKIWGIDPRFRGMEIFDVNKDALSGVNGIYTHNCYTTPQMRADIHPQPSLIKAWQHI